MFSEATQPWWDKRFEADGPWPNSAKFRCIRTERYKYMVRLPDRQFRLYDLQSDPGEQINLLDGDREYDAALLESLSAQLQAWNAQAAPLPMAELRESDALHKLKTLGYVAEPDEAEEYAEDGVEDDGGPGCTARRNPVAQRALTLARAPQDHA